MSTLRETIKRLVTSRPPPAHRVSDRDLADSSMLEAGARIDFLTASDLANLDGRREAVAKLVALADGHREGHAHAHVDLGAVQRVLDAHVVKLEQIYEMQSLGVPLGDALVGAHGFRWVVIEDAHAREPVLRYRDTAILVYPLTLVANRLAKGQKVVVSEVVAAVERALREAVGPLSTR